MKKYRTLTRALNGIKRSERLYVTDIAEFGELLGIRIVPDTSKSMTHSKLHPIDKPN